LQQFSFKHVSFDVTYFGLPQLELKIIANQTIFAIAQN
jgi:hypothetical protein